MEEDIKELKAKILTLETQITELKKSIPTSEFSEVQDDLRSSETAIIEIFKALKAVEEKWRVKYVRRGKYYGIEFR